MRLDPRRQRDSASDQRGGADADLERNAARSLTSATAASGEVSARGAPRLAVPTARSRAIARGSGGDLRRRPRARLLPGPCEDEWARPRRTFALTAAIAADPRQLVLARLPRRSGSTDDRWSGQGL